MSGENPDFLTSQIITYIGNKRALLKDIDGQVEFVKSRLGKNRLVCADLFSGSGIVARLLKRSAKKNNNKRLGNLFLHPERLLPDQRRRL